MNAGFATSSLTSVRAWLGAVLVTLFASQSVYANVKLPNVFGDHMVLQQGQKNKVWGTADAGEAVTVSVDKQTHSATAAADGTWNVMLEPLAVGGPYELTVKGKNEVKFTDILVGEVWVCSGQSNMQWSVKQSNDPDLEKLAAKYPKIRMINFPQVGTQSPIWSHDDRRWKVCTPETVDDFSAVGYFFARQLYETLGVPIGMINNAWGGSACEAWINRDTLNADPKFKPMMDRWVQMETKFAELTAKGDQLTDEEKKALTGLTNQMGGNHRPANIYNGVLKSHLGYGIKGAIWYQGESNAGRAYQYRDLFPLMIKSWRDEWKQGDFPFYWVQLADFYPEKPQPDESSWAELREAQTMTMTRLPNTGEAVIIDIGEGRDIHPKNKVDVGRRLARWALAKDYGVKIAYHSPQYKSMAKKDNKIVLTFDHIEGGWRPFDVLEPRGFSIATEDGKFVWAKAAIQKDNTIEVWSDEVTSPAAVRYGWADNPIVNMFGANGLPLTPFRTDSRPGATINAN
ncbi:sialate O-acetylesterase [Schlesneria paludicola]|uniref:sialate O-acetylesterase n=1 Tax=Schlesneria paludicola TaxID=360056 RepID=UPI00029AD87A|nr:sialate O-acetylesterase [Schlesneria paludicola]